MAKITIFGLAGTGTSTVGRLLAQELGYHFLSSGMIFRRRALDMGLTLEEFEKLCSEDSQYDSALDFEVELYGKTNDDFVAESRLAWHFIPDSYKVKFVCDDAERLKRIALRDGVTVEEAKRATEFREQKAIERYRDYYGIKDFAPNGEFDLIIDTTKTSPEEVVERIIKMTAHLTHKS